MTEPSLGLLFNDPWVVLCRCSYINLNKLSIAKELYRVLKKDGNMFFVNYPKQNAHLRVKFLDEVCHDVYEYVWCYGIQMVRAERHFTAAHRTIPHCTKSDANKWDMLFCLVTSNFLITDNGQQNNHSQLFLILLLYSSLLFLIKQAFYCMQNYQIRSSQQHSRLRVPHHIPDLLPSVWFIAVYSTL